MDQTADSLRPMDLKAWLFAGSLILPFATAAAQTGPYPVKPIRLIVPSAPGGGVDMLARFIGQGLTEQWHQQVVVDARPGATGIIGTSIAAKASPDGHTLLLAWVSPLAINPSLYAKLPYDVNKDLSPIMDVATIPNILVVKPSLDVTTVKDFVALAKARPGQLSYASSGIGGLSHLAAELLKVMTGINIVHVPYKSTPPAIFDLIGGRVDALFAAAPPALPQIRSGKLKAIAVSTAARSPIVPDLPAVSESIPGFSAETWYGLMAPAGTPQAIILKLNAEIARSLKAPGATEKLAVQGFVVVASSSQDFARYLQSELVKWRKVIKSTGIQAE